MSNVSGRPFSMVIRANSLMEVFIFYGGCLGRVTGPRKEVLVVVEMVVGMVGREVLTNLGALMEVVILVLLMVGRDVGDGGGGDGGSAAMGGEVLVRGVEGLMTGIVARSLGLSESSGKTSHIVSHSISNSFSMRGGKGRGVCRGW